MSAIELEHVEAALLPQNGDNKADVVGEKPVEDPIPQPTSNAPPESASIEGVAQEIEQDDKLDEFARLELELAELNKSGTILDNEDSKLNALTPINAVNEKSTNDEHSKLGEQDEKCLIKTDLLLNANANAANQNGQSMESSSATLLQTHTELESEILNHEDLIAVLKGETISPEKNKESISNNYNETEKPCTSKGQHIAATSEELYVEGVTIEGEGEYQIMEVVDDLEDESESNINTAGQTSATTKSSPVQKLTREEERAMAMEQIANLKRPPRRRKQDIKPLPFETSELVSTLGADWSDDGDDTDVSNLQPRASNSKNANAAAKTQNVNLKKDVTTAQTTSANVAVTDAKASTSPSTTAPNRKRRRSTGANVTNVILLPSPQGTAITTNAAVDTVAETAVDKTTTTGATGFKRTRTIKRRIIWDPDAPETAFSYANLVRSKSKERQNSSSPVTAQKPRSTTPKDKRQATDTIAVLEKKPVKRAVTPSKANTNAASKEVAAVKTSNAQTVSTTKQTRRSQTVSPVANGGQSEGRKKKISEIDRLMRDEGAASMLSSLESERGKLVEESNDDRPHKPLMRSRAGPTEKIVKREPTPTKTVTASAPAAKKARVSKAKASTSWDYVYQKKQELNDDSMIIRRRSNSSYSSNASQHRLSIDGPLSLSSKTNVKSAEASSEDETSSTTTKARTTKNVQKSATKSAANDITASANSNTNKRGSPSVIQSVNNSKSFEFLKPKEAKGNQKTPNRNAAISKNTDSTLNADMKKATTKRGRPTATNKNKEPTASLSTSPANETIGTEQFEVVVRKGPKMAQIIFSTHTSKLNGTFSPQLMDKIVDALDSLANDTNCNAVVLLTNASDFCRGLDLSGLATGSVEQRKTAATLLATSAKNFLKTLATFPKPLVAGINGSIIGLGVTQLPLFDVVISSDKVTLEAPYMKIGQIPEGFCIWQSLWNIRSTAKTKLFWLAEKLQSTEAASIGLVTKLTTTDKVNDDAINSAKKIAGMSHEAYRKMKSATIKSRLDVVLSALDEEFDEIVKQWTSSECHTKVKKYIEIGHF